MSLGVPVSAVYKESYFQRSYIQQERIHDEVYRK